MTSQVISRIEYLILTYGILMLIYTLKFNYKMYRSVLIRFYTTSHIGLTA